MNVMNLLYLWVPLLIIQNFSFTIVSRARNSGSDWYHAIAAVFSNGVWWASQTIIVVTLLDVVENADVALWTILTIVYVTCTVTGSVLGGKVARRFFERGNRRVGSYKKGEGGT